jgi:hypothetical protein
LNPLIYKVQSTQEYLSLLWFSSIESIDLQGARYSVVALELATKPRRLTPTEFIPCFFLLAAAFT